MIANVPDVILTNYTTIHRIWQDHREVWGEKVLRNVEMKDHYNPYLYLVFSGKQGHMVWTTEIVLGLWQAMLPILGLVLKLHDNSELSSSEMHLRKFPDHPEFQSWIVNFRTEVCSKAKNPMLGLQWIKEIEVAKSLDDLITPKSITGKTFTHCEELELMMAAALKRCYDKQTLFWKKVSVEGRVLKGQPVS